MTVFRWKHATVIWLLCLVSLFSAEATKAATVTLNANGGSDSSNGLKIFINDNSQIQVQRLNSSGQLYQPDRTPANSRLDNGIYIRGNNTIYGPDHFAYNAPGSYTAQAMTAVTPANASAGNAQTTRSQFTVPANNIGGGPQITIDWSYTYPYDFVTAKVTINIPLLYPVSSSNPVRYYHVVDTYLGGSDCGCGVRYVDTNGKQVAGTYPYAGSCSSGSGNTNVQCPSSTSLPANLDVVESFRERDGKFGRYCVGNYQTFWSNDNSVACAIAKTGQLGNTVNTTLTDTGAAIEYDFTSPGTYTFSYDFVVGSTLVPDYDHLEIRHPGSSSLCPVDIQVMACLVSTMPCPDNQLINSGSLTGTLTISPNSPTVTVTPDAQFDVGSDRTIDTITLQGSAAATYTLGATGLSKGPMNGIKCWNTANNSQSCSFTMTNTACVNTFECMESAPIKYNNLKADSSKRNPLYTKVLGQSFDVEVVAVLANGEQSNGYNSSGLKVDLVTDSNNTCSTNIIATKSVSFMASDGGHKTVTFNASDVKQAYTKVRCQVSDAGQNKSGCSSDNFAIRPQSFTVSTTNTSLSSTTPSPTYTYKLKAGTDSFNLTAVTGESGYNGTPSIDTSKVYQHDGVVTMGQISYDPITPNKFPAASSGTSSSDSFKYSEVGFFQFAAQGVYDDTFTAVDKANGDCDNGGFDNTGTGTPKKYGCNFGNTAASSFFGRFIPNKFVITTGGSKQACSTFVYYNQDTSTKAGLEIPFTITAQNGYGATTTYYTGTGPSSYAKFNNPSAWANFNFSTNPPLVGGTLSQSVHSPALQGGWSGGKAAMTARFNVTRPASPIAEQTFSVTTRVQDSDGVATDPATITLSSATYRYGRVAITPAHGSELLPLIVPVEVQYWGGGGYRRSSDDTCTSFPLNTIAMKNYRGNLNACETVLSVNSAMNNGVMSLRLSAPGVSGTTPNTGSVDLDLNFGSAGGDRTCTSSVQSNAADGTDGLGGWFGADPSARATFGIYKAPIIYMRENF
ncbi:DUF6701 domain-containing protein [Methylophilus sp. DW102]|uniref:DUF6701 domain-containing protein n=1 Tax=Methylophilus sp. DW102 TaxID=3095607 RepID=UPI003086EDC0|nr:hypothetical protein MTDW_23170 [Methylophilus sp. DW102]